MADSEVTSLIETSKELRRNFLERICEKMYNASQSSSPTNKVPWGYVSKIIKETKSAEPWVTKNKINFAYKKFCADKCMEKDAVEDLTIINSVLTTGGRPKGSTIIKQQHYKETFIAAKNELLHCSRKSKKNAEKR